jgi:hypothetical protein
MYRVVTFNLTSDASDLDPEAGAIERGEMTAGELMLLLERFRDLNLVETGEDDPYIELTAPSGKFHIRTTLGRLLLYNARASLEPYIELTPTEIVIQLERSVGSVAPFAPRPEPEAAAAARRRPATQRAIAAGILAAGLLINAYTIYSVTYVQSVNVKPNVTLLTEPKEIAARRTELVGTYVTGDRTGDRVISLQADGHVQFAEIGRPGSMSEVKDTYQIGRRGPKLCLVTGDGSVIDVVNLESLTYFRDSYRRKP